MQRRLEDVSHFFFDPRNALPHQDTSFTREPSPGTRRSRIVHVAGSEDHVTAAMIVAGLALSANRRNQSVLAAETHEYFLGVAYALGAPSAEDGSVMVEADSELWVSRAPLLGTRRPGVLFDLRAIAAWETKVAHVDVVLIRLSGTEGDIRGAGLPMPDECLVVVGENADESSLYRTIKWTVSWNPSVQVGLVTVSPFDDRSGAPEKLTRAVETFLGRPCPTAGTISAAVLAHAVCSEAGWKAGREELARRLSPIASRWETPDARVRSSGSLTAQESAFFHNG
jgi:hypothetical protein